MVDQAADQGAFGGDPNVSGLANTQSFQLGTPGGFIGELITALAQGSQGFSRQALFVHVVHSAYVNHIVHIWPA